MAPVLIFLVLLLQWSSFAESLSSGSHPSVMSTSASSVSSSSSSPSLSPSPVAKIKLPPKLHDINFKGSFFSYNSNGRGGGGGGGGLYHHQTASSSSIKPLRDFVLESESVKELEENFVVHLTETIISKLNSQMRTGIPALSIPPLDPLRLKPIRVEPTVGGDRFTLALNDLQLEGLSDFDIHDLRPKLNALKVRLAILFPRVKATCHFTVNGSVYGNVVEVAGEGHAELEYTDVLFRTQLNLVHENSTFQVATSDPPLVDFASAKIRLSRPGIAGGNESAEASSSELSPLLFWILADHVVQEVDQYMLKYVNSNMLLFKVPESFTPVVTWLMNRSGLSSPGSQMGGSGGGGMMNPFQIGRFSPFPILNHWINSLSGLHRPSSVSSSGGGMSNFHPLVNTRLFKK